MTFSKACAQRILYYMNEKGLTPEELSKRSKVSIVLVYDILNEKIASHGVELGVCGKLCKAFSITLKDFFNDPAFETPSLYLNRDGKPSYAKAFGARLRELIEESDITQARLADLLDLSRAGVSTLCAGKARSISFEVFARLCAELNVTVRQFYDSPVFDGIDLNE